MSACHIKVFEGGSWLIDFLKRNTNQTSARKPRIHFPGSPVRVGVFPDDTHGGQRCLEFHAHSLTSVNNRCHSSIVYSHQIPYSKLIKYHYAEHIFKSFFISYILKIHMHICTHELNFQALFACRVRRHLIYTKHLCRLNGPI